MSLPVMDSTSPPGQHPRILLERFLVTACKRSLGQGNVFTLVCHSVHRWVGFPACITGHMTRGVCIGGGSAFGGVCLQGGLHTRGSASGGSSTSRGSLHARGFGRPPIVGILQDAVNRRTGRILLGCILVENLGLNLPKCSSVFQLPIR